MANAQANVVATRYAKETGPATGTLTFTAQPTAADTIVINGTTFTYNTDITIGSDVAETVYNTVVALNASTDVDVDDATYTYNGWNGTQSVLTITHDTDGTAGNSFTLAVGGATPPAVSGANLSGGYGTIGTTPAIALTNLRCNNPDFNANINTTTSQELRSDRNITDLVRTSATSEGTIGFELTAEEYEPFFESGLGGRWSGTVNMSITTGSALASDNSFNDSANGFSTTDILPGMFIRVGGFVTNPTNNGIFKVVSVTRSKIIVAHGSALIDESPATMTVKGKSIRNAARKTSFTLEREFTDIGEFMSHTGMLVGSITLNAASEAILDGSISFLGRQTAVAQASVGTGTPNSPTANPIMSAVANVGEVYENDTLIPSTSIAFKSINLTTNNNNRSLTAIGDLYPIDINMGSFNAEFAVEAYFSDTTLLSKYLNGTVTELAYTLTDDSGNSIVVDAPQVKYSAGTVTGVTLNSDVMQSLTGTVLYDPTLDYALQISYLPA